MKYFLRDRRVNSDGFIYLEKEVGCPSTSHSNALNYNTIHIYFDIVSHTNMLTDDLSMHIELCVNPIVNEMNSLCTMSIESASILDNVKSITMCLLTIWIITVKCYDWDLGRVYSSIQFIHKCAFINWEDGGLMDMGKDFWCLSL